LDPDAVWGGEWGRSRMGVLDGGGDRRRGRDSFGGEFWASHCNQWGHRRALPRLLWEDLLLLLLLLGLVVIILTVPPIRT